MKLLDCSLRDGGYYTNWEFKNGFIDDYLSLINCQPVDIIEVGYRCIRKNTKAASGKGKLFHTPYYLIDHFRNLVDAKISIMYNWEDILLASDMEIVQEFEKLLNRASFLRIAVTNNDDNIINICNVLDRLPSRLTESYNFCLNIMNWDFSQSDNTVLSRNIELIENSFDIVYLVDSYGSTYPSSVEKEFQKVKQICNLPLGFHAHDNIELAFANCVAASEGGAHYIDSTVQGIGRGAGNAKTELVLTYLHHQQQLTIDFASLSQLVKLFEGLKNDFKWGSNLAYYYSGFNNLRPQEVADLLASNRYRVDTIISLLTKQLAHRVIPKEDTLKEKITDLSFSCQSDFVIIGGGSTLEENNDAFKKYVSQKKPNIIFTSVNSLLTFSRLNNDVSSSVLCLLGDDYSNLTLDNPVKVSYIIHDDINKDIANSFDCKTISSIQLMNSNSEDPCSESPLFLSLLFAITAKAKSVRLIGFDGYTSYSRSSKLLTEENQNAINWSLSHMNIKTLTPSLYMNLDYESIYSLLDES